MPSRGTLVGVGLVLGLLFLIGLAVGLAGMGSGDGVSGDELADEVEALYETSHDDFYFEDWRVECEDVDTVEEGSVADCDVTVYIVTRGYDYNFNQRVRFVDDEGHFEVPRIDDQNEVLDGSVGK